MKKILKFSAIVFALIFAFNVFLACNGEKDNPDPTPTKTITKIAVDTKPKDFFVSGEEFSVEGGVIKVTYSDGTTELVPLSSDIFEVVAPSMSAAGNKTVTVKVKGTNIQVKYSITIGRTSHTVTFVLNYEGAQDQTVSVVDGDKVQKIIPTRTGYTFYAWYMERDFIRQFDFDTPITGSLSLYALWLQNGVDQFTVTFNYDYYGGKIEKYSYPINSGAVISRPANPTRVGYIFDKWLLDGAEYNFATPVTQDIELKASWIKQDNNLKEWLFEAEDTDLTGKVGPAISGTAQEKAMIVTSPPNKGCSNNRFVSFMYQRGNSVDFFIACDEDLTDVTLIVRLSAEYGEDYTYTKDNYGIYVNGVALDYPPIEMKDIPTTSDPASGLDCLPFRDFVVGTNLTLNKGANLIQLITENDDAYEGTTMLAHAPIIDCIKIKTTGVVIWDANFNLPFPGNYY